MTALEEINRFEDLLSRQLDDGLEEAGQRELLGWLSREECAAQFLEMMRLDAEIAGLLSAPVPDRMMAELVLSDLRSIEAAPVRGLPLVSRPARAKRGFRSRALAWAAVFGVLLALPAIYFSSVWRPRSEARVAEVHGEVYLLDASGRTRLAEKQPLSSAGRLKTVGPDSSVVVLLGDGTRIEVGGDSAVATEIASAKVRIVLDAGALKAQVAPQSANRALSFQTPDVEAIVRGTALSLAAWPHHTRIAVTEGQVLVKRREDGAEVIVRAGYHVLIAPNVEPIPGPNDPLSQPRSIR